MATIQFRRPTPRASSAALDRLQRDIMGAFDRPGAGGASVRGTPFPPVNLYEGEEGFVLTAEIPGVEGKDLQVTVEDQKLTIRGERAIDYPDDGRTSLHRRERPTGLFRRTFNLPQSANPEKTQAVCRHGILIVRIPKAESARPRRISVRAR
jgi:HSP20 family protein